MSRAVVRTVAILVGLLLAAFLPAGPALAGGGNCITIGQDLVVPEGETCSGDAIALGGNLAILGTVGGDAVALGGSAQVEGSVGGDLVVLSGEALLGSNAHVGGNVIALGGVLERQAGAVVEGDLLASGFPPLRQDADRPPLSGWLRFGGVLLLAGLTFGLALLLAVALRASWPRRTRQMVEALRRAPFVSLGAGLLSTLLLAALLPLLSLLLAVIVVGVFLLPLLYALVWLFYMAGLAVAGITLGRLLLREEERPRPRWLAPAVGLLILTPLTVLPAAVEPFWGYGLALLAPSAGLGAILLSRVGTLAIAGDGGVPQGAEPIG